MTHANVSVKIMLRTKKIMVGILGHVFARIYLRFENSVWWNYICHGYYINKCHEYTMLCHK